MVGLSLEVTMKNEWGFVRWKRGTKELILHNRQGRMKSIVRQASVES